MRYKSVLYLLFVLTSISFQAQTILKGTIISDNKEVVGNASLLVKNEDEAILQFGFTNDQGLFEIAIENEGKFVVEVNKIGFIKHQQTLIVSKDKNEYILPIILNAQTQDIKEVVIKLENPIRRQGDTLVFNAKSFSTGSESVVEDLLKNLPGITFDDNGTIKFEDIPIEKVMVEGDDFFNRGYSTLTKNMPIKPVDKVEVLQNYSNNKLLKGIEESNKVALNLTINEAYKDLWFGDISVGYGLVTENNYDVSGNLMNFSKKYKNFLTYGLNNVGVIRVGSLESMFYNNYEVESIGLGSRLDPLMNIGGGGVGLLKDQRTKINNDENISLSTIVPVTEKLKLKVVGFLGVEENYAYNNSSSVTNVGNTHFENIQKNQFKRDIKSWYLNALVTYDISNRQLLQVSSVFSKSNSVNTNDLTFNESNTQERLQTKNTFFDQKLTYTHKWKKINAVLFKTRFYTNKIPQFYVIDDYLMGDLFDFDAASMTNDIKNEKTYAGVEADFKLKQKNSDLIEFQIGLDHHKEAMNTFFNLHNHSVSYSPEGFQTDSSFGLSDLYLKSGYTWKWTNFKISGNTEAHQLFNEFKTLTANQQQNLFYINPSLRFNWDFTKNQSFRGSYSINYSNTSFVEVNDTYLLTSSRSFSRGLGAFELTDYQNASIGYSIKHYMNKYRFQFGLNYGKQSNILSNRSNIEQNSSLSESVLIKGGDRYGGTYSFEYYVRNIKSLFRFEGNYSISTSFNEINNSGLRKNNYEERMCLLSWRTSFKTAFNFALGTKWTFSKVTSPDFQDDFSSGFSYLNLIYKIDKQLDINATTEYYYFGKLASDKRDHVFLDLEANYKFKDDKWTLGLRGTNLFNKTNFSTYYVSYMGYSSTSYRLMSRYILLSCKYRFNL